MGRRIIVGFGILLVVSLISSCRTEPVTQTDIVAFLEEYQTKAEFLDRQLALCRWESETEGHSDSLKIYERAYAAFFGDRQLLSRIKKYVSVAGSESDQRKLELIHRRHLRTVIDQNRLVRKAVDSLANLAAGFGYRFEGESVGHERLFDVIASDRNRLRREEAYHVLASPGLELADGVSALVRLRNQAAARMGYNSYYYLMLTADGIDKSTYSELLMELDELSTEPYRRGLDSLGGVLNLSDLQIWDIEFARGRILSEMTPFYSAGSQLSSLKNTFNGFGLRLDEIPIYLTPGINENGMDDGILAIEIPLDIRVVTNIRSGPHSLNRLFRQAGRAVYAANIEAADFFLCRPPAPCFEEAMSLITGNLIGLDSWLRKYGGLPEPLIARQAALRGFFRVYDLRLLLVQLEFEREMYKDPYADLNQVYGDIFERYMMLSCSADLSPWAAQTAYLTNPVGLQNNLIAACIAAQTYHYLDDKYGSIIDNQHTREFLVQNFYRFGGLEDWQSLLSRGTGENLKAEYYMDYGGI